MEEKKKRRILVFSVDALVSEDIEYLKTCPNFKKYLGGGARVVATGGMGRMMAEYCPLIDEVDPNLTLEGLRLIYENNKDAFRGRKLDDNIGNIEVTEEG